MREVAEMAVKGNRIVELVDAETVLGRPGISGLTNWLPAASTRRS